MKINDVIYVVARKNINTGLFDSFNYFKDLRSAMDYRIKKSDNILDTDFQYHIEIHTRIV